MASQEGIIPNPETSAHCDEADGAEAQRQKDELSTTSQHESQEDLSEELERLALRENEEELLSEKERENLKSQAIDFKNSSNQKFQHGAYEEAKEGYTRAIDTCPLVYKKEHAIFLSNRAACMSHLNECEDAIKDCTKAIDFNPDYMKPLKRRAELYERTEKLDESLADFKLVLEKDSRDRDAILACQRLPPMINERNEKLKTEMVGKLKDLGNLVLKPFGLSTENFQFQQNDAGGYSVNFKQ